MLVHIIPVKTLAKMLLILMMGPSDKAPYTVTLSKEIAPSVSLVQLPNGYYQLQCAGSNDPVYFSGAQLQGILNALPSEVQCSISTGGRIDLNKLAAYIIRNELLFMGSSQLPREYDDRSSASSGPRNTVVIGASISVNEQQNDNRKMYVDFEYTFSPEKIQNLMQRGDVPALLSEQRNIERTLKMRVGDKKTLTESLDHVDKSLIDWGSLTPALQAHRNLQKQGKKKEIEARLQLAKDRLASIFGRLRYGERELKLEIYYLEEKILKDPITNWLHAIAYGEGPESSEGRDILNKQWTELTPNERAIIEKQVGFHPIRVADSLRALRSDSHSTNQLLATPQALVAMHQSGDKEFLQKQCDILTQEIASCTSDKQRKALRVQLEFLQKRLNDPMTESLHVIKTADLAIAKAEYEKLKKEHANRATTMKYGGALKIGHAHDYLHNYGFDHLEAAKAILESRPDYQTELATTPFTTTDAPTTTAATGPGTTTTSTTQSCATSDLPATGVNTSPSPSIGVDATSISTDLDQMVLDMVTTGPKYLPISLATQGLINSKLVEIADKYQADDALLYLETLANVLKGIPEMGAGQIALSLLQALRTKGYVELSDFTPHQQCALYFAYGAVEQVTDIKGLMHVNPKLLQLIIEWKIVTSTCGLINAQVMQNLGLDSELLKLEKAIQGIDSESITKVFQHIALMSPQEKSRALGNITGAFLQAEIIAAAMPTALKGIEKITQVVAESRIGQSVAQSVEELEKFAQGAARIGTAEEVIAVTAEGIPIRIATAAEETMSLHKAANKAGGAAKEVPAILKVGNIKEFFQTEFGKLLSRVSEKTHYRFQEKAVYKLTEKLKQYGLKAGDVFYLDALHMDHIEVFDSVGKIKAVFNLDGTLNVIKTNVAKMQGRTIKF